MTPPSSDERREAIAAIIAGFHEPSPKDGPATLRVWIAAIRKADAILSILSKPSQDAEP